MVQTTRSGKQNITEGCAASITLSEMEIKLLGMAKAGLQELLIGYQDYPQVRELAVWDVDNARTVQTRRVCAWYNDSAYYRDTIKERSDETIADIAITLIHQADILFRKYINQVRDDFVKQDRIRGQTSKARIDYRKSH